MTATFERRRIEVLADAPLVELVVETARKTGIKAYTLLPTLGGAGAHGNWSDDQVTRAESKVLFLAVTSEPRAAQFIDAISPMLESHGLVLLNSRVEVVRGSKF